MAIEVLTVPAGAGGRSMEIDAQLCGSVSDPVRVYFD
jgi:hypothetical protein